jgi:hypothetical protein
VRVVQMPVDVGPNGRLIIQRGRRGGLREPVEIVRILDGAERSQEVGISEGEADAKTGE